MTVRQSSYRSLTSLQRDCRTLPRVRGGRLPDRVAAGRRGAPRAASVRLRPGARDPRGRAAPPWRGRAGQPLRRWLELDEDEFYATFYCASVTRCYPGRAPRAPATACPRPASANCARSGSLGAGTPRPQLILTVGGLALGACSVSAALTDCDRRALRGRRRPRRSRCPIRPVRAAGRTSRRTGAARPRARTRPGAARARS